MLAHGVQQWRVVQPSGQPSLLCLAIRWRTIGVKLPYPLCMTWKSCMTTSPSQHSSLRPEGWGIHHWCSNWDCTCTWPVEALGATSSTQELQHPRMASLLCTQSTTFAKNLPHAVCHQAYDTEISEAVAR
eukprot:11352452-Karenia_brevis.AAC.1